jgi:uncharacterized repeat protein (TIGR03803 family)
MFNIGGGGALTTLYSFTGPPGGESPVATPFLGADGALYGITAQGGAFNWGTIFRMALDATPITFYSFCSESGCTDGSFPNAPLIQAASGNFYGTTSGKASGYGTVYEMNQIGDVTTLYTFCSQPNCADGGQPYFGLTEGTDGNLYGTTSFGGANGGGTVFRITPAGALTTLYNFCSLTDCKDGTQVYSGLTLGTDGNFYGTTYSGGANNEGTVFQITPSGVMTTLYSFCPILNASSECTDGAAPYAGLVQSTNGVFYGTTHAGGAYWETSGYGGVVFSLSMGLGLFVKAVPAAATPGAAVLILGNNLSGATSVTFNGMAAGFTVVSPTEIATAVPAGATTGPVQVAMAGGVMLSSNANFVVFSEQTVTFTASPPASAVYGAVFVVAATASSGLPVSYSSSGACTNSGATYTVTSGTGTCSVTAIQAGNSHYLAATLTQSTRAVPASQTIAFTKNAPASAAVNSSFTVAATASSGLAVAYTSAGACTNSGATYTMAGSSGTCSVIANQTGNSNYAAAPQITETTNVLASQTITFTTNAPASAVYGSSFTVAATASSGLPVSFTSSEMCSNSGATYTMTSGTGTCTVIANQAGDSAYAPAPQATETTPAAKASPTVSFTGGPASAPYQSTFTVAATSSAGVSAAIGAGGACSVAGAAVTMTSGSGTCRLTAHWPSTSNYLAASATQSTTAQKLAPTITWATPSPITYGTAIGSAQLDASASVPGAFTYTPKSGTILKGGNQTLRVTFVPTSTTDYLSASDSVTLVVNPVATTTAITSTAPSSPKVNADVAIHFAVTAGYGTAAGTVVVIASTGESCNATLAGGKGSCSITFTTSGSRLLTAAFSGSANDAESTSPPFNISVSQ